MKKFFLKFKPVWDVMKNSSTLFYSHDTFTLGAALSYYTVFSIAPILIIIISIAGAVLGPDAVEGQIKQEIQGFLGSKGASELQELIKAAYQPGKNWIATAIAVVLLIIGALSLFGQIRTSLNIIWEVKPQSKKPVLKFLLDRVFSFGMIISLAFLMLVSLVLHAGISGLTGYIAAKFSWLSVVLIKVADIVLSLGIATVLFALMYKYLSDARLKWGCVWQGAIFTAVLFALGKYLIGLYIGKAGVANTYGAAGSGVLILVWVFYSSQIVFFGAEFTRALAMQRGMSLDPVAIESHQEATEKGKQMAASL